MTAESETGDTRGGVREMENDRDRQIAKDILIAQIDWASGELTFDGLEDWIAHALAEARAETKKETEERLSRVDGSALTAPERATAPTEGR